MADSTWRRETSIQMGKQSTPRQIRAQAASAERQIPVKRLQEAAKAGVLKSSSLAIYSLNLCIEFYYGRGQLHHDNILRAFKGFADLETSAVTGYLVRNSPATADVGEWMLSLAAELGNPFAVTVLSADRLNLVKSGKTDVLDKLESIAKEGENPRAMVVHGIVLAKRGQLNEALEFYEKANEISKPVPLNPFLDFMLDRGIPHPWSSYGALKANMGDSKASRKALEYGAAVYENMAAIDLLARNAGISKRWDKYVEYLTKLAMDGEPEASFQLGAFYLKNFYEESKKRTSKNIFTRLLPLRLTDPGPRSLAIEWLRISAEYGHSRSALLVAGLLREDHKFREGVLYLDTAEEDPDTFKSAQSMRNCFLDRDAVIDLESELPANTYKVDSS